MERESDEGEKYWCHMCRKEFKCVPPNNEEVNCMFCGDTFCEEIEEEEVHPSNFHPIEDNQNTSAQGSSQAPPPQAASQSSSNSETSSTSPGGSLFEMVRQMIDGGMGGLEGVSGGGTGNATINIVPMGNLGAPFAVFRQMGAQSTMGTMGAMPGGENNPLMSLLSNIPRMLEGVGGGGGGPMGGMNFNQILQHLWENDPNRHGTPPASKMVVKSLPQVKVDEELLRQQDCTDCGVCKEEFLLESMVFIMPCKHIFHPDCLLPWLEQHNSCPLCRHELATDDMDYENSKASREANGGGPSRPGPPGGSSLI